ncbi:hypothetical protein PG993_011028 [Apiospora rasikravindrae]|uniref:Glycosyltransferase family 69 protein n=1 Tax=Apiospora rasikravindrae TaxID=990691 RepID=A0ABR1SD30_9PEZI
MRQFASSSERQPFVDPADQTLSPASSTTLGDFDYAEDVEKDSWQDRLSSAGGGQSWNSWFRSRQRGFRRILRRHPGHPLFTVLKYTILLICILFIGTPILAPSYTRQPKHYRDLAARCEGPGPTPEPGCANPFKEKVFISVSLYDKDGHLATGSWGRTLLELVQLIGEDNVFVSIYENDSGEAGEKALNWLKSQLRCRHKVVYDPHVSLSDFPTIRMPDGTDRIKRLAYLSEMRNRPLRPLDQLNTKDADSGGVVEYDKILFLNDVAFHPIDAAQLLFSTNVGPDGRTRYLSTCGMDFFNPLLFYDLYAQRDAEGFSNGLPLFPYFSNAGAGLSRAAVLRQADAVPVTACWGGIVAMQARHVQNLNQTLPDPDFRAIGHHVLDPAQPAKVTSPVRFRYEPEVFYDACECCLFLADVTQAARQAGGQTEKELGTYVNPYVRVAYSQETLAWLPWVKRWERLLSVPQRILTPILRLPTHNPHRAVREGESFMEEVWVNNEGSQGGRWQLTQRQARNGLQCGVREMQLVQQGERTNDVNWQNTKMPPGQTLHFPT